MTVDDGNPKVTIPKESLIAILSAYLKAQGKPYDEFNRKIHSKSAKQLWLDLDKDTQKCLELIENGAKYAESEGWNGWSWTALKKHKDSIMKPIDNGYKGW
jgi:hypothetical protein